MDEPKNLSLTANLDVEAGAAPGADGKAPLPRFSMVAYTGGPMRVAGWRYPVVVDLAGMAIPSQNRPIRFGHDANSGVGHTDSIRIQDGRLVAAGVISRDTSAAKEVVVSAKNGFPWQASIGAGVEQFEFVKENQAVVVNGREFTGPVNVVRKSTLGEISFVDLGADGNTSASVAAKANMEKDMEGTEAAVKENLEGNEGKNAEGKEAPKVESQAKTGTEAQPPAVQAAAVEGDPVADMRARAAAEQERIVAVRKICGEDHAEICAKAIQEGWDVTRTELEVLRAERPKPPVVHMPDNSITGNVLEAACMLTAGLSGVEKLHDEKTPISPLSDSGAASACRS